MRDSQRAEEVKSPRPDAPSFGHWARCRPAKGAGQDGATHKALGKRLPSLGTGQDGARLWALGMGRLEEQDERRRKQVMEPCTDVGDIFLRLLEGRLQQARRLPDQSLWGLVSAPCARLFCWGTQLFRKPTKFA